MLAVAALLACPRWRFDVLWRSHVKPLMLCAAVAAW
jgi:hypothetical protein